MESFHHWLLIMIKVNVDKKILTLEKETITKKVYLVLEGSISSSIKDWRYCRRVTAYFASLSANSASPPFSMSVLTNVYCYEQRTMKGISATVL